MKGLYYKRSLSFLDNGEYFPVQQFFSPNFYMSLYIDLIRHYFKQKKTNVNNNVSSN